MHLDDDAKLREQGRLQAAGREGELRKRQHYEKPCEERRRAELRKKSTIRKNKLKVQGGSSQW